MCNINLFIALLISINMALFLFALYFDQSKLYKNLIKNINKKSTTDSPLETLSRLSSNRKRKKFIYIDNLD